MTFHTKCFVCRICGKKCQPDTAKLVHGRPHCDACFQRRVDERDITPEGRNAAKTHKHVPEEGERRRKKFVEGLKAGEFYVHRFRGLKLQELRARSRERETMEGGAKGKFRTHPHKHAGHKHRSTHHEGEKQRRVRRRHRTHDGSIRRA
jgi:hypothetical protein